jgi:periplasmic protein TonB
MNYTACFRCPVYSVFRRSAPLVGVLLFFSLCWHLRAQAPLSIPSAEALKSVVSKVNPDYPAMAKQMRVVGSVEVEALIDTEGSVETAHPVSGNPLLTSAACNAVKKWKFKPFSADGKPAKALVKLNFNFVL